MAEPRYTHAHPATGVPPKVKIAASVVLYRHTPEALAPTLASLLACSQLEQLILVDNGGCAWARDLADPRVVYLDAQGNVGYGAGHNLAIHRHAGLVDYYAIVNPDVSFAPGSLERLAEFAQQQHAGMVMPDAHYPDGRRQYLCKLLPTPLNLLVRRFLPACIAKCLDERYELHQADYRQAFFVPYLSGCFMLCNASLLAKVGGFDERFFMYLEDTDLTRRMAEHAPTLYYPDVQIVHHFNKQSYRDRRLLKIHLQSALRYFNKWGWYFDSGRQRLNRRCLDALPTTAAARSTRQG